ncbi:MAG: ABC transporter substrate-binding protein, partial [Gammaproteobacteria bacterium]
MAFLLGLASCGPAESPGDPRPAVKTFRYSMDQAPTTLDPVQGSNIYANFVIVNAYDTLYSYKYLARPYELKPNLAVDFPAISADGLVYTFRLKPGVHFVDDPCFPGGRGREVVAEDFIYSIKRQFDPANQPQGAWLWQDRIAGLEEWKAAGSHYDRPVAGLRAIDAHTLEIRLVRPYPQLVSTLAQGYSALVPREAVEKYGKGLGVRPVGSGPFRLVSYDTARVVMERNPHFRQEPVDLAAEGYDPATQAFSGVEAIQGRSPPFVDRLEFNFINEPSASWTSFTKGDEIQLTVLPIEQVDRVLASKHPVTLRPEYAGKYHVYAGLEAGFVFTAFNMDFPEFGYNDDPERARRNKALRCAIIKGYDWEARNKSWYFGLAEYFPGIIVPASPEFDPDLSRESVTRDVAGARRLLKDNGWTPDNLPELVYGTTAGTTERLIFEQFRAWMRDIGFPREKVVQKTYANFGDISRAWKRNQLPLVAKGWGLDYPDAENTLQLFYGPNGSPGSNDANWKNAEFDRLYEQTSVMQPSDERTALYRRMNQLVIDDCVAITGISRTRIFLWDKDVIGLPDREILGGFWL